eukprot:8724699-Pyramimonas_sp.AAC.1
MRAIADLPLAVNRAERESSGLPAASGVHFPGPRVCQLPLALIFQGSAAEGALDCAVGWFAVARLRAGFFFAH